MQGTGNSWHLLLALGRYTWVLSEGRVKFAGTFESMWGGCEFPAKFVLQWFAGGRLSFNGFLDPNQEYGKGQCSVCSLKILLEPASYIRFH